MSAVAVVFRLPPTYESRKTDAISLQKSQSGGVLATGKNASLSRNRNELLPNASHVFVIFNFSFASSTTHTLFTLPKHRQK